MNGLGAYLWERRAEIAAHTGEHLVLVVLSTLAAVAVGIPLGVALSRRPRLARPVLGLAGVVQTIPSLALFGFLIPLPFVGGIGPRTAIVALILYALLPILRNTYSGIRSVDPAVVESATGLGLTARQRLWWVEVPLSLPVVLGGVRIAIVVSIGIATIAAAVGAGGLGVLIYRGIATVDNRLILAGALPAALLAVVCDGVARLGGAPLVGHEMRVRALPALLLICLCALLAAACGSRPSAIRVGSKNFSEQVLLGEVVAQALEGRGLQVDRKLNLGGTFVCHQAIVAGELDLYPEYTGTAYTAILKEKPVTDPAAVRRRVSDEYARRWKLIWSPPLGFENTFALVVRPDDAARLKLATISDLAARGSELRPGFGYEFVERADGYPGLARAYGLSFKERPVEMDLGLLYPALASRRVDVVAGNSTDGLIAAIGGVVLADDRHYFPPYEAAFVVRGAVWRDRPEVKQVLESLAGRLDAERMRRWNAQLDKDKKRPEDVAREVLREIAPKPLTVAPDLSGQMFTRKC